MKGFDRLKASFQKAFRGDWSSIKIDEYDKILQKTQSQMAELRADMELVDEYGARGWEIEKELYWEGGNKKVEIDAMNIEKGIIEETKSGIPNKMKTLKDWMESDKFRDWIDARVKGLKANGLFEKIHIFKLSITKEMLGDMTKEEVENLFNKVLKEEGLKWKGEINIIEW